jgi:hypothetical protein
MHRLLEREQWLFLLHFEDAARYAQAGEAAGESLTEHII